MPRPRLRRGPWMLGLTLEDRVRVGAPRSPVAAIDLGFELTRRPARVTEEDFQAVHGLVAAEEPHQQNAVRAQVNTFTRFDRMLGRSRGAKQEPDGLEVHGSPEVE